MAKLTELRRSRSLLLKLVLAVGVFTLLIAALLFITASEKSTLEERLKRIQSDANNILYYDEVLTMSARMFTYTGDENWWQRYSQAAQTLEQLLTDARQLDSAIAQAIDDTSTVNDQLIELETRAFEMTRTGQGNEAAQLLLNDTYRNLKQQYSQNVDRALDITQQKTQDQLLKSQEQRYIFLMVLTAILSISFISLLIFLLRYNNHIDNSIDELHQSLEANLQALEQKTEALKIAKEAKTRFLANLSHEIRTPLNGVTGNLQLLKAQALEKDTETLVDNTFNSTRLLSRLLADLLDFSDMETGNLTLRQKPFNLADVLNEVATMFRKPCNDKGLQFIIQNEHCRDGWLGDADRLCQLLFQLVDNAIKFTDIGSVSVILSVDAQEQVQFEIIDTGIGIKAEDQPSLFTLFEQVDNSTTRKKGGTGIGMAYVKALTELMGGEITLTSEPQKGTRVCIKLPLQKVEQELCAPASHEVTQLPANTTILVAEDNKINQMIISSMLTDAGAQVILAENGLEAITLINRRYQLVLLDIQMPEMDGIEACERFKLQKPQIPVIALTANVLQEDIALYEKTGFDDILAKPVDKNQLIATLNHHLAQTSNV